MKKILKFAILLNMFLCINLFAAKNLYISYNKIPTNVYKNQKFEVVVKALITTNNFDELSTTFTNSSNITILNPKNPWKKISDDTYENSYYFKVKQGNFKFPDISVVLMNSGTMIDSTELAAPTIKYSDIAKGDERFSGVIADDFFLKAYKTKQYNNKEALTIIDVDAINSNLEDFKLKDIEDQAISSIKDYNEKENLVYYFVTPIYKKKLVITYYNTKTKSFKDVIIPLLLQNELVSTQTDLNPNDSSFEQYKKVAAVTFFVIFFLLFIWKRKRILLILSVIFLIISIIYLLPNPKGIVKKDSFVYILPTKNSTVFFKIENEQKVEVLEKKNGFLKVLGSDSDFIGWIKEESFGEN
ncbi:MAG: hypothetical protein PHY66_02545 [Aliarcobacter sp.]|nr:hypothetical protein [Aliarcobacter sp.]